MADDDIQSKPPFFLIGVVLAGILIVVSLPLITGPLKLLFSNSDTQEDEQNLMNLATEVAKLGNGEDIINVRFALKDRSLVGFDKAWDKNIQFETCEYKKTVTGYVIDSSNMEKPEACKDMACLCMFKKSYKSPTCRPFPDVDYFVTEKSDTNILNLKEDIYKTFEMTAYGTPSSGVLGYNHLVFNSICQTHVLAMPLKIEKREIEGKVVVIIAPGREIDVPQNEPQATE